MLALDMLASLLISVIGMVYPIVTNLMLNDYIPGKAYKAIVIAGCIVLVLYIVRNLFGDIVKICGYLYLLHLVQRLNKLWSIAPMLRWLKNQSLLRSMALMLCRQAITPH